MRTAVRAAMRHRARRRPSTRCRAQPRPGPCPPTDPGERDGGEQPRRPGGWPGTSAATTSWPGTSLEGFVGHIPGAVLPFHAWLKDASDPTAVIPEKVFADILGDLGVDESTTVVAYDDYDGSYACRLWWVARYYGLSNVRSPTAAGTAGSSSAAAGRGGCRCPRTSVALRRNPPDGRAGRGRGRARRRDGRRRPAAHPVLGRLRRQPVRQPAGRTHPGRAAERRHRPADRRRDPAFLLPDAMGRSCATAGLRPDDEPVFYCQAAVRSSPSSCWRNWGGRAAGPTRARWPKGPSTTPCRRSTSMSGPGGLRRVTSTSTRSWPTHPAAGAQARIGPDGKLTTTTFAELHGDVHAGRRARRRRPRRRRPGRDPRPESVTRDRRRPGVARPALRLGRHPGRGPTEPSTSRTSWTGTSSAPWSW